MLEFKSMNICSFQTAVEVWNEGFQGYAIDLTLSLDRFLSRLTANGISPEHSLVAFSEGKPVGFVLTALRTEGDMKLAWNGGTGVIPAMRGKGVGKALIDAAIELYETELVDVALLEAIHTNSNAIKLYEKCGYQIVDELSFLNTEQTVDHFAHAAKMDEYHITHVPPEGVSKLAFYQKLSAWQTQAQSVRLNYGEAFIVSDARSKPVGYALYKRVFDEAGKLSSVALFQCEVAPDRTDAKLIATFALNSVFPLEDNYRRGTSNLRKSNKMVTDLLLNAGFTTFIDQVHMIKTIRKK